MNASERDDRIISAVRATCGDGSVFLVLSATPEQDEDLLTVLVDDRAVALVAIDRGSQVVSANTLHPEEYKRGLSGVAAIEFDVARRYARQLLA